MADLISRAAAKFQACNWNVKPNDVIFDGIKEAIKTQLDMAPTVDAAPVVRCRDCKHRPTDKRSMSDDITGFAIEFPDSSCPCQCGDGWYNWYPDDDWFCADGERRDDDAADAR